MYSRRPSRVLLAAVKIGIGERGCGSRGRQWQSGVGDAEAGGGGGVAVGFAVGVVGGGLDEGAV